MQNLRIIDEIEFKNLEKICEILLYIKDITEDIDIYFDNLSKEDILKSVGKIDNWLLTAENTLSAIINGWYDPKRHDLRHHNFEDGT